MGFDKKEMIEQLKFEIQMIEKGRYFPSVREPHRNPEIFRDTWRQLRPTQSRPMHEFSCGIFCSVPIFLTPQAMLSRMPRSWQAILVPSSMPFT